MSFINNIPIDIINTLDRLGAEAFFSDYFYEIACDKANAGYEATLAKAKETRDADIHKAITERDDIVASHKAAYLVYVVAYEAAKAKADAISNAAYGRRTVGGLQ